MFWGWAKDWQAYKERVVKEKLKWENKHSIQTKLKRLKGLIFICTLIATSTLWLVILPVYGIIKFLS